MKLDTPPLCLVEVGCEPEGLPDPVVTKEDGITLVSLDWSQPDPTDGKWDQAVEVLREYRGAHPRIDKALARLESHPPTNQGGTGLTKRFEPCACDQGSPGHAHDSNWRAWWSALTLAEQQSLRDKASWEHRSVMAVAMEWGASDQGGTA